MNTVILLEKKEKLEKQKEQLIGQLNYVTGAIALLDELIVESKTDEPKNSDS
jgi:hypothetical protein